MKGAVILGAELAIAAAYVVLWVVLFAGIRNFLRWKVSPLTSNWRRRALPGDVPLYERMRWFRLVLLLPKRPSVWAQYAQLLSGVGAAVHPQQYFLGKRIITVCSIATGGLALVYSSSVPAGEFSVGGGVLMIVCGLVAAVADKPILEAAGTHRRMKITKEMHILSHQLLYYSASRMNLHAKLMKCAPYTKTTAKEWTLLLHEWYEDADEALRRFRERLGTDEAYGFAETLNTLRLHEDEQFYDMLRARIKDYKEKLALLKDSRKESYSYILFVLAGLPILNTFRVFIYPWVEQGRKLFETLNS